MSCQALRRGTITEITVRKLPDHVLCQASRRGTITEITVIKLPDEVLCQTSRRGTNYCDYGQKTTR